MIEKDWELEAGLKKEKPAGKKFLAKWAKEMPTLVHVTAGSVLILLGMTALTGGGIAIQATSESKPVWANLGALSDWICWFIIWIGFDMMIFKERATPWLLSKFVQPVIKAVLRSTISEERYKVLEEKLEREANANS